MPSLHSHRVSSLMSEESEDEMAPLPSTITTLPLSATAATSTHTTTPSNNVTNLSRLGGGVSGVLGPLVRTPWSSGAYSWLSRNGWLKTQQQQQQQQQQLPAAASNSCSKPSSALSRLPENIVAGSATVSRVLPASADRVVTSKPRLQLHLNNKPASE